jgi:hypothetical protein
MGFLIWLESTSLSVWMRESPSLWAFPFVLYLHTLGLALLAGLSTALAVWVLMSPGEVPPPRMRQFFPLMWLGFFINTLSGVLLLIAYRSAAAGPRALRSAGPRRAGAGTGNQAACRESDSALGNRDCDRKVPRLHLQHFARDRAGILLRPCKSATTCAL